MFLKHARESQLYHIQSDYEQANPIKDHKLEAYYIDLLTEAMKAEHSPAEQYERLGLPWGE